MIVNSGRIASHYSLACDIYPTLQAHRSHYRGVVDSAAQLDCDALCPQIDM